MNNHMKKKIKLDIFIFFYFIEKNIILKSFTNSDLETISSLMKSLKLANES